MRTAPYMFRFRSPRCRARTAQSQPAIVVDPEGLDGKTDQSATTTPTDARTAAAGSGAAPCGSTRTADSIEPATRRRTPAPGLALRRARVRVGEQAEHQRRRAAVRARGAPASVASSVVAEPADAALRRSRRRSGSRPGRRRRPRTPPGSARPRARWRSPCRCGRRGSSSRSRARRRRPAVCRPVAAEHLPLAGVEDAVHVTGPRSNSPRVDSAARRRARRASSGRPSPTASTAAGARGSPRPRAFSAAASAGSRQRSSRRSVSTR